MTTFSPPFWNEYSNEWEVTELNESGESVETHNFNTEDQATAFIREKIEKQTLTPAQSELK